MPRRRGAGQREKAVRAHGIMGVPAKWSTECTDSKPCTYTSKGGDQELHQMSGLRRSGRKEA